VPGDEVRTRRFVLVDDEDNERAALHAGRGESVEMAFAGRNGKVRTALGMTQSGGPFLAFTDASEIVRVRVDVGTVGEQTNLSFRDEVGRIRTQLMVAADGATGLVLADSWGQKRAELRVGADGHPALSLYDRDGNVIGGAVSD
jgi:hypothetical protein